MLNPLVMMGNTLRFLILNNDKAETGKLKNLLTDVLEEEAEVCSAPTMGEGLKILASRMIDLIFLDINIGRKQGFELINQIPPSCRPSIVLIADEASMDPDMLNYGLLYYLWRPLKKELLQISVSRLQHEIQRKRQEQEILYSLNHVLSSESGRMALPSKTHLELIAAHQILRCESDSNYTHVYTIYGTKYTLPKTLKEVEKGLAPYFFRIHRSHIVNLNLVKKINGKELMVEMINGSFLPISEDRKSLLIGKVKLPFNHRNGVMLTETGVG